MSPALHLRRICLLLTCFCAGLNFEADNGRPARRVLQICRYSWHLRGEIKTKAQNLVEPSYLFQTCDRASVQARNRLLAANLRTNDAFTYRVRSQTGEQVSDIYQAPIIQQIINRVYFKTADDDGIVLSDTYSPFPMVGLALVLAAIECAIDEWSTGLHSPVKFTEEAYRKVYQSHLANLQKLEELSGPKTIVTGLCKHLYKGGRTFAKVGPDKGASDRELDTEVLLGAIADFDRNNGRFEYSDEEMEEEDS